MATQFDKYVLSGYYGLKSKHTVVSCILTFLSNQAVINIPKKTYFLHPAHLYYTPHMLSRAETFKAPIKSLILHFIQRVLKYLFCLWKLTEQKPRDLKDPNSLTFTDPVK